MSRSPASEHHDLTLYDYLVRNAAFYKGRTAVTVDERAITFDMLRVLVDQIVILLQTNSVKAGERIALWQPNSIEWVAVFLAAAATGAVVVPINTRLTPSEMSTIIDSARPRILFAPRFYRGRQYFDEAEAALRESAASPSLICIEENSEPNGWARISGRSAAEQVANLPRGLFSVKFTSGTSTGSPKGVMLTHANYITTAEYAARLKQVTHNTDFVSAAPFFHTSGSMHCISVCMVSAATLHSMSVWDAEKYLDVVERHRATVSHAPLLSDVFDMGLASRARDKLRSLQTSTVIGSTPFLLRVVDELDVPNVFKPFGMTETCGMFTMCSADDPLETKVSSQGRPHIGNKLQIVDDNGREVEPNGVGEIQLSGIGVTPGYFNNDLVNAAAFTKDRWLKTGDLGTVSERGELTFVSRMKDLIKTGGENFTSAEVEQVLMDVGVFKEVAVFSIPDSRLDEIPVAAVLLHDGQSPSWNDVMRSVSKKLANFKVPKRLYIASEFPKTVTDKVQKTVLRDQVLAGSLHNVIGHSG